MEEKMVLGNFIKTKRKEAGLSQKDLAEKLFVTESAVSKWERGLSYPDIALIPGLCRELDVTEKEFFAAQDDSPKEPSIKEAPVKEESTGAAQKKIRSAKTPFRWKRFVSGLTLGCYGIALVTCFICNLAIEGGLSWFYIVLTALLLSASLFPLPLLLSRRRILTVFLSSTALLFLLEYVCNWYTGGDWFGGAAVITAISLAALWLLIRVLTLPAVSPWLKGAAAAAVCAFLSAAINPLAGYLFGYGTPGLWELLRPTAWTPDNLANKISLYGLVFISACCLLAWILSGPRGRAADENKEAGL